MYESISGQPQFAFVIVLAAIFFGCLAITILGVSGMVVWRRHQATKMANGNARPRDGSSRN